MSFLALFMVISRYSIGEKEVSKLCPEWNEKHQPGMKGTHVYKSYQKEDMVNRVGRARTTLSSLHFLTTQAIPGRHMYPKAQGRVLRVPTSDRCLMAHVSITDTHKRRGERETERGRL